MASASVRVVKFALLLVLLVPRCGCALNTLESVPAAVNGTLTACSGNPIAITCSHGLTHTRSTTWNVSPPVNCSTVITHTEDPVIPPCGSSMFMFQGVNSVAASGTTLLHSTAVVNASVMLSGSVVECRGGNRVVSESIGTISLCVVGQSANLECMNTPNGLLVSWNAVTDTSCAESPVKYNVTVVRQSDGMLIDSFTDFDGNGTEILNQTMPSVDYSVSISARTTIALCDGELATTVCTKSADLLTTGINCGSTPLPFLMLIVSMAVMTILY